jgi:hypothetical protein
MKKSNNYEVKKYLIKNILYIKMSCFVPSILAAAPAMRRATSPAEVAPTKRSVARLATAPSAERVQQVK